MQGNWRNHCGAIGWVIGATLLHACAFRAVTESLPDRATDAVVSSAPADAPPVDAIPAGPFRPDGTPDTARSMPQPPPARPPRTAVVVSDDISEYLEIVTEILARGLENVSVHMLDGQESRGAGVIAEIERAAPDRVIAIGLLAATVTRAVAGTGTPTVFCQVYNYAGHELISATSKGVHLLPPFDLQFRAWRSLAPEIDRVGVITGPGQEALLDDISAAAAAAGIALAVRTVRSDQEALLAFKELVPEIQGLSLLPDNRILSPAVVSEILAYGAKHERQVAVFGAGLLDLGALFSITNDPRDVVDRVLARFANVTDDGRISGPDMTPLTRMRMSVNDPVAERLGIAVPEQLAGVR